MLMSRLLSWQGRLALAGVTAAQVVPQRWQAPLRGHAPEQLLGADGRTLLQEVRARLETAQRALCQPFQCLPAPWHAGHVGGRA